jgi:hypothetical protein
MPRLGDPMLNVELNAGEFEGMTEKRLLAGQYLADVLRAPAVTARLSEVRNVVGE